MLENDNFFLKQLFILHSVTLLEKNATKVGKRLHVQGCNSIMPAIKNDHQLNLSSIYAVSG